MSTNNSINFPNLTVKSTPTTSDLLEISDQAAGGIPKQSPISGFPALNVQQITQYSAALNDKFSCSMPGQIGSTQSDSLTQVMGVILNSNIVFVPFFLSTAWTTTNLNIVIKTGLAASTATLGIYGSTLSSAGVTYANFPIGAPLGVGSVSTATSNSFATASVAAALSANTLYWAAIQLSSAVTVAIAVGNLNFGLYSYTTANIGSTSFVTNVLTYANTYSVGSLPTLTQSGLAVTIAPYCPIIAGT